MSPTNQSKILEILQPRQGLLVKPLLYKDEIASAPTQKHLSEVLSGGGEEDFQSCKMSFFTQIISVQPNLPQGKVRVLLKIIGLGIGYPSDTDHMYHLY